MGSNSLESRFEKKSGVEGLSETCNKVNMQKRLDAKTGMRDLSLIQVPQFPH